MKQVTMAQLLLILVCLTAYSISAAQSGYVVTTKGDTVKGKIKYMNYGTEKKVQVTDASNKKTVYSVLQTSAFNLDNELYRTVRIASGYTFMKLLKDGYLSLYAYQIENQNTWDGRYLQKKDGSGVDVPNIGFKKILARYLSDCEDVVNGLESRELNRSKLSTIIDEYNQCVAERTEKNYATAISEKKQTETPDSWLTLENAVKESNAFEGQKTALEIITELKLKLARAEKIPNFLLDGLKNSLKDQSHLKEVLEKALLELK
jgi:hypothetical protein